VQDTRALCTVFAFPNDPVDIATFEIGQPATVTVRFPNDTGKINVIPYEIQAFAPDMEPSGALRLNNEYPGQPVRGVIELAPGAIGVVGVQLTYRWLQPYDISDLVVSTDSDGDGVFEPLNAIGIRSVQAICRADVNADGTVTSQDFFDFLVAFFNEDPAADFNQDQMINSQDFFDFIAAFFGGC